MKHTPGPWKVSVCETPNATYSINKTAFPKQIGTRELSANAHLIAAAPELYEFLSKVNSAFYLRTSRKEWIKLMEQSKPLLKKARGES